MCLLIIFLKLDILTVHATAFYILRVCRISEKFQGASDNIQAGVQCTGRNPVILLNTKLEPYTHRLLLQAKGHAAQAFPSVYMLPPIILPPAP
jgi:hypothetical protein